MSNAYHKLAVGDFAQDWSNTGLITSDDNWGNVPSIVGYLGDVNAASPSDVDPRTLTAAALGAVDVIANSKSTTINNGGVAEFEIADPTVALQGSGTADAPSLVLYLDTTGREQVRVKFNARDVDATTDDAAQQLNVQYRVGSSGDWTNVTGGYFADVTTKGTAAQVTPVDLTLPAEAANKAQVEVRILTTNAGGNDEWVGIDDIQVSSVALAGATKTQVSVNDVTVDEGAGTATFTVTRSDTQGAFTIDFAAADGTATAGADFTATKGTLTFAANGSATQTVKVAITDDALAEAAETFTLNVSNLVSTAGSAEIADASGLGTITDNEVTVTKISAVQGAGATSARVGETVTVRAVVVGDFQNGDADTKRNLNGFYLQEEAADSDGNPLTSEGIFVFQGSTVGDVTLGDVVEVTGKVGEFGTQTQIAAATIVNAGPSGIADLNTLAATIDFPVAGVTKNASGQYLPDLEAYEGMLVKFTDTLTITEQFNLDRFNEVKLTEGARPFQFTHNSDPSKAGYDAFLQQLAKRSITYDDGLNTQNQAIENLDGFGPVYNTATAPRMGDTIANLTGVLDSSTASTFRVRAVTDGANDVVAANPRQPAPQDVGGTLKVGSFNVLNYFKTLNTDPSDDQSNSNPADNTARGLDARGANTAAEFNRQTDKLVTSLLGLNADVLGLIEIENDFSETSPGNAVGYLVQELNARAGAGTYDWIRPGQQFVGGDAIAVAYIYKPSKVQVATGTTVQILDDTDPQAAALLGQSTLGRIFNGPDTSRAALAVTFAERGSGETFTAVVNHLKSKSGNGTGLDADQQDGAGAWNNQRKLAAQALSEWVKSNPTGTSDRDTLILGDLNAYFQEDPIDVLKAAGYENLQETRVTGAYSYVFDGQLGSLDYILSNPSLSGQVTGVTEWHINADEADALDYNLDFGRSPAYFDPASPVRVSDHDPILIGLALNTPVVSFASGSAAVARAEGNAGTTPFAFTVARTGSTTGPLTVTYAVAPGTGSNPANAADFGGSFPTGQVTFAAGQASATFTINVAGDALVENDETFSVSLSGATTGAGIATGTILDDDAAPPVGPGPTPTPPGVTVTGAGGGNQLRGGLGNDTFSGGIGLDFVLFQGLRAESTITVQGGLPTRVTGPEGSDALTGIERLVFRDGVVAFDTGSGSGGQATAGEVYRLYQAVFDRTPDLAGLSNNVRLADDGLSLRAEAAAFVVSAEFRQLYGENSSDTTFVTALYQNVLNRAPDQAGLNGWLAALSSGSQDRAGVLIGFSEAVENKALVASAIQNGILLDLSVAG